MTQDIKHGRWWPSFGKNADTIRDAIVNVEQNHDVIFHNMRSLSFVDGLKMGLQYGFEISAFGESELDIEELSK